METNNEKIIKIKHHESDSGFCKDTFVTVGDDKKRYFNRCTESGAWYHTSPYGGYFEHSHLVSENIIFQIMNGQKVLAIDGNGDFPNKKPFVTGEERYDRAKALFADFLQQNGIIFKDIEAWKQALRSHPAYQEYKSYDENWLYYESGKAVSIERVATLDVFGDPVDFLAVTYNHSCGINFTHYCAAFTPQKSYHHLLGKPLCDLAYLLLYTWEGIELPEQ